jgi:hypothetical protein
MKELWYRDAQGAAQLGTGKSAPFPNETSHLSWSRMGALLAEISLEDSTRDIYEDDADFTVVKGA